jgi:hypothetical protein
MAFLLQFCALDFASLGFALSLARICLIDCGVVCPHCCYALWLGMPVAFGRG